MSQYDLIDAALKNGQEILQITWDNEWTGWRLDQQRIWSEFYVGNEHFALAKDLHYASYADDLVWEIAEPPAADLGKRPIVLCRKVIGLKA